MGGEYGVIEMDLQSIIIGYMVGVIDVVLCKRCMETTTRKRIVKILALAMIAGIILYGDPPE